MMENDNAVTVRNVSKTFATRAGDRKGRISRKIVRNVIEDISLDIKKGEVFGIIGRNGSGKSTFLKMISMIMTPSSGTIETNGRVASILELGMGFHQDLSGKENIYIKGSMYGFTRKQIDGKLEDIVRYADLEDYIDLPIRVYSSGMVSRLAFAIMINVEADILILDEVLSTGDLAFGRKSGAHFSNMKSQGKTIIIVAHSMTSIRNMCDRVAWIDGGRIREIGPPNVVCGHYEKELTESFEVIQELAESGVPASQNTLGCFYRDGNKVEKNLELAAFWFEEAVKRDNDEAKVNLADLLVSGDVPDRERALDLYMSAAQEGNRDARTKLARLLTKDKSDIGKEVAEDFMKLLDQENHQLCYDYGDILMKTAWNNEDRMIALDWFQRSAELGNANAMHRISLMYRDGTGPKRDSSEHLNWLKMAADAGHSQSQLMLGNMYKDGVVVDCDEHEAFHWYKMAAENNNLDAIYQVSMMYREGKGTERNKDESDMWLRLYSEHGLYHQINVLADSFSHCKNGVWDPDIGIKWYSLNSRHNSAESEYHLSLMFMLRDGFEGNEDALSLLTSAAEKGHLGSASQLLNLYGCGLIDVSFAERAVRTMEDIARKGNSWAAHLVGSMYSDGKIMGTDREKAVGYLTMAANSNVPASLQKLGEMYRDGVLVEQNIEEAVGWFRRGAMSGNVWSATSLINMYGAGSVDKEVFDHSLNSLRDMCLKGNAVAMRILGTFYRDGRAMEIDRQEAIRWLTMASKFGDVTAKHMLGEMYRDGNGVEKNLPESLRWFISAAEHGNVNSLLSIIKMYGTGQADASSFEYALERLEQLARGGDIVSMRTLGTIHSEGKGVPKNEETAKEWFKKASFMGDVLSRERLKTLN